MLDRLGLLIANKWLGGTNVSSAIREARRVNSYGERAILNYLGEDLTDRKAIGRNVSRYFELIRLMKRNGIIGSLSVKPTQLGLAINEELFVKNYSSIARTAASAGVFVWLDMENYNYISKTVDGYIRVHKRYGNTGICIQARVRRSLSDLRRIVRNKGRVRLVKGAYGSLGRITYNGREEIDGNYRRCMRYLFEKSSGFMIATHDLDIIEEALRLRKAHRKMVEFAMLKGIRGKLARRLVSEGNVVNIYIPFGEEWFAYAVRRLKEEGHLMLLLRSILQG